MTATMIVENPKLDIESLSLLKKKIEVNKAHSSDYERLDYFLSAIGFKDFLLNKMKENNIYSFEEYILEREKEIGKRNNAVDGIIYGTIMGTISVLEKYILNNIK